MPSPRHAGFAMLDVLVALLLLAVTLSGAGATLIQAMRASHGALLATRAVDLAADLSEQLREATSQEQAELLLADWRARVAAELPVAGMAPDEFASVTDLPWDAAAPEDPTPGGRELRLRWWRAAGEARELRLPVVIGGNGTR